MEALAALQAVALVLLAMLVGGLLRSHAHILRTLHRLGAGLGDGAAAAAPDVRVRLGEPRRHQPSATATVGIDLAGVAPSGEAIAVAVRSAPSDSLLAFLSSTCFTCHEFWHSFARPVADLDLPPNTRLVIVTKAPPLEDPSHVAQLAPAQHPVVMSSEAWQAYGVPTTPFFLHVDGRTGEITGQGAGGTWAQVSSLLRQATGDARAETEADVDRKLLAAGIRPGDPSLYPSRRAEDDG